MMVDGMFMNYVLIGIAIVLAFAVLLRSFANKGGNNDGEPTLGVTKELYDKIDLLTAQILSLSNDKTKLETEKNILLVEKVRLEEESLHAVSQNEQLVLEVSDYKIKLNNLQKDYEVLEKSITERNELIANLKNDYKALNDEKASVDSELNKLKADYASLQTALNLQKDNLTEREEFIKKSKDDLANAFKNIATQVLDEKKAGFDESLASILTPYKNDLTNFKETVDKMQTETTKERQDLKTYIEHTQKYNSAIQKETHSLINALKSDSKRQGDWGEMILERVLESSGLIKNVNYLVQESYDANNDDEDSKRVRLRPDVVVILPDNKKVIIDSKVSLTAYAEYVKALDDERTTIIDDEDDSYAVKSDQYLQRHIDSVNAHIAELTKKEYNKAVENSLEYVIMFMPIEGAYTTIIDSNYSVIDDAFRKRIIIATPSTLMMTLKIVDTLWRFDKQSKNAQKIVDTASKLYDKFATFADKYVKVEKDINDLSKSFEESKKLLTTGRGNAVKLVTDLRELGANTSKQLPTQLEYDDSDDAISGTMHNHNSLIDNANGANGSDDMVSNGQASQANGQAGVTADKRSSNISGNAGNADKQGGIDNFLTS